MIFRETPLSGAYVIEQERREDERGYFARTFCAEEFAAHNLATQFVQANTSLSVDAGTLRGLHFQRAASKEVKLIRCVAGALWDVIVDIRDNSPTYLKSFGTELSAENGRQIYVPKGFAHGFLTLKSNTMVAYMVDEYYTPDVEGGFRFDDPALAIEWPHTAKVVSEKDRVWPLIEV